MKNIRNDREHLSADYCYIFVFNHDYNRPWSPKKLSPGKVLPHIGQKSEHVIKSLDNDIQCEFFENLNTKTCYTGTKFGGN